MWKDVQRWLPWMLIAAGGLSLGTAFASQYIGGLQPCVLCIYQRYPYGAVIALGLLLLLARRQRTLGVLLAALAAVALLADAAIAAYHVGVEQHWWQGTDACSNLIDPNLTLEELKQTLQDAPVVACDEVPWSLFGISMAGYNFIYALVAGIVTAWATVGLTRQRA